MTFDDKTRAFMDKITKKGSVLGLDAMCLLMQALGDPQEQLQVIHVAGTNGKGSTCAMLQSILCRQGYRVGLYTSPAVFCYEERFSIDGAYIDAAAFNAYMHRMEDAWQEVERQHGVCATIFEVETALAYLYFYEAGCDYVIMEVGMGGATDASNVLNHSLCSVFAAIGRDHMQFLGPDLESIASIKAGIMKAGGQAVSTWQEPKAAKVLEDVAKAGKTGLTFCDESKVKIKQRKPLCYDYKEFSDIEVHLEGSYQLQNSVLVLETIRILRKLGVFISDAAVKEGMQKTVWQGRMECLCKEPLIYMDGAHNLPAAKRLWETLESDFTNKSITYIMGVLADKEYEEMLALLLPRAGHIYTVTPDNARALPAEKLQKTIENLSYAALACPSLEDALYQALQAGDDMILAFGSLSYLGDFKKIVKASVKEEEMFDHEKIKEGVRLILEGVGEDVEREGLLETPDRVARMYEEIFAGMYQDAAEPLSKRFHVAGNEMVLEKDIVFYSTCEHHLMPFFGKAHVAYIPKGEVVGLSKIARTVEVFAKRPQLQEQLTAQIADAINEQLHPMGVMVMLEAEHTCMTMRGVKKPGSKTVSYVTRGIFAEDTALQDRFFQLVK